MARPINPSVFKSTRHERCSSPCHGEALMVGKLQCRAPELGTMARNFGWQPGQRDKGPTSGLSNLWIIGDHRIFKTSICFPMQYCTGWWFGLVFFHILGLFFFRGIETTNQLGSILQSSQKNILGPTGPGPPSLSQLSKAPGPQIFPKKSTTLCLVEWYFYHYDLAKMGCSRGGLGLVVFRSFCYVVHRYCLMADASANVLLCHCRSRWPEATCSVAIASHTGGARLCELLVILVFQDDGRSTVLGTHWEMPRSTKGVEGSWNLDLTWFTLW